MNVLLLVIIIGHICPINKLPGFTKFCVGSPWLGMACFWRSSQN